MVFDIAKLRDDARVLDSDAAPLDSRIPDVAASVAGVNAAKVQFTDLSGIQGGRRMVDMLASTRPPTRLDNPFLRASAGILAPGTLFGATRPDKACARGISAFADNSMLKTVAKFGSPIMAESQANAATVRGIAGRFRSLRLQEESTRQWRSIYSGGLENTAFKQVAAVQRSFAGRYAGSAIGFERSFGIQPSDIGRQVARSFLRTYEPSFRAVLESLNTPLFGDIGKLAGGYAGSAKLIGELAKKAVRPLEEILGRLRREMEQWPRDPYGEPVPIWNVRLHQLAQAAYEVDYVARARFLDEIEADGSPDNVLMIEELLKPTFDPERLDLRVDWEQMDPAEARRWLRQRLNGLKLSAWKEEQERKNGQQPYEGQSQVVEAIASELPELELHKFELREDEGALYEHLRAVLPEQQFLVCLHRVQGLEYKEIAARMGVALGTVKAHAHFLRRNPNFLEVIGR